MQIYSNYDEEPEDVFLPLSDELYQEFYDLELGSFTEDLHFYTSMLPPSSCVLELGCGSGRLTSHLIGAGHGVVGVDLSFAMLKQAAKATGGKAHLLQMDMRNLAFQQRFDAVIIPYNTLNLLLTPEDIEQCLRRCHESLQDDGRLLLQLHVPIYNKEDTRQSSFQFQMFDRPQGGKLIKEIIKVTNSTAQLIEMTERYKVRPMTAGQENSNYFHTLYLNGWKLERWQQCFRDCGFEIEKVYTGYSLSSNKESSTLLINAKTQD